MNTECNESRQRIPRSMVGDLTADEQQSLDRHLEACPSCRSEWELYAETVRHLQEPQDEPVPRHFFLYPQEQAAGPWRLFRQLTPVWQGALACVAGLLMLVSATAVSGLQLRSDGGAWSVSLGRGSAHEPIRAADLKADILKAVEARDQELAGQFLQELKSALAQSRSELTQQQQMQLVAALNTLEARVNERVSVAAEDLRDETGKSIDGVIRIVSQQRERDLDAIGARFELERDSRIAKARETDAVLDTLLQLANLNFRQAGEQK